MTGTMTTTFTGESLHHLFEVARSLGLRPPNTATRRQLLNAIQRRRQALNQPQRSPVAPAVTREPVGELLVSSTLTVTEAGRLLGRYRTTIHAWLRSGRLTGQKTLGGHWRVDRDSVERLLRGQQRTAGAA